MVSQIPISNEEDQYFSQKEIKEIGENHKTTNFNMQIVTKCRLEAEQYHIKGNHEKAEQSLMAAKKHLLIFYNT
ncbi:hypothetical protein BH10BAC1_BH10BAC1_10280 [soil metagenome]